MNAVCISCYSMKAMIAMKKIVKTEIFSGI